MTPARDLASGSSRAHQLAALASLGTLLGVLLSGPVSVALVSALHPQPPWRDAALFARNYHPLQMLPYAGGIVLVAALVFLMASMHAAARERDKSATSAALVFTSVFATFIFFNYVTQTTLLPSLARPYDPASAPTIATFSMSNPKSLAWGIEMWGWGFLGVATWLTSAIFARSTLERAAALTFAANGPVSIAGALITIARPGWVATAGGLVAFSLWNALLAGMAVLAFLAFRRRVHAHGSSPGRTYADTPVEQPAH
jgi:hypothetical protein